MSGIDGLMPKPDDRWATATRRAQGVADLGLGRALKTYYTLYFPAGVIILFSVGMGLGILAFGSDQGDWASLLAFGFNFAALGAIIGGLLYNAKKIAPAAELGKIDVLVSLENEERKDIRREVLGKAPVDPNHLAVSRAVAVQLRKNLATQLTWMPALVFLFIPQVFRGDGVLSWVMALAVAVQVIAAILVARDFRRTGRFLARTGGPRSGAQRP